MEPDAQIIRTIYDLYHKHRNVRVVKSTVDKLGLKTAIRTLSSGQLKGGSQFSFGHIYHILINPIYAGRIRHKANIYPGQHLALIEPAVWDALQEQLKAGAVMPRSGKGRNDEKSKKQVSLLSGKVFDETGDRLTPSHTKSAKGRRLRYYVSHRLIRSTGPKDPSGWRLPGPALEAMVAELVAKHLKEPTFRANIVAGASVDELAVIDERLIAIACQDQNRCDETRRTLFDLIQRVDIAPGDIKIELLPNKIAEVLNVEPGQISEDILYIASEFQHLKRGVETRLILANTAVPRDETLFKNIALAHRYFGMIRAGKTYSEIAGFEGASKRRVQQLVELAFLAPDVIRDAFDGRQPTGMTSEWLIRHSFPTIWQDQREMFRLL